MGSNDKLKTAKIKIAAENQALDGYADKSVRKPKKAERQKSKKVIKEELRGYDSPGAKRTFKVKVRIDSITSGVPLKYYPRTDGED